MIETTDQDVEDNYLNLDDVMAHNSSVSCVIQPDIHRGVFPLLGLKTPVDSKIIKADIPLWLLPAMQNFCEISLPKAYNAAVQNVLRANASSANLDRLQQYFYTVGILLSDQLEREQAQSLSDCLVETLVQRVADVISKGLESDMKDDKYDALERRLFEQVSIWRKELQSWTSRLSNQTLKRKHV